MRCASLALAKMSISPRFTAAPVAACDDDRYHSRALLEVFLERFGILSRDGELEAGRRIEVFPGRLQDHGFGLHAKAWQLPYTVIERGATELLQGLHVELVIEGTNAFRAEEMNSTNG